MNRVITKAVEDFLNIGIGETRDFDDTYEAISIRRDQVDLYYVTAKQIQQLKKERLVASTAEIMFWYHAYDGGFDIRTVSLKLASSQYSAKLAASFIIGLLWHSIDHPPYEKSFGCFRPTAWLGPSDTFQPAFSLPIVAFEYDLILKHLNLSYKKDQGISWSGKLPFILDAVPYDRWDQLVRAAYISLESQAAGMSLLADNRLLDYIKDDNSPYHQCTIYRLFRPYDQIWRMLQMAGVITFDFDDLESSAYRD